MADVDLVVNDSGGAVARVFTADHPEHLHTLTLTNCETQDNLPPKAFLPTLLLARIGLFARLGPWLARDIGRARKTVYGSGYQGLTNLPDDIVRAGLKPLLGSREAGR
ncbi:MAG: hypothetical protein ACRDNF_06705 [Streptosporangiaceae bacterium]